MPARRRTLALLGGALASTSGCIARPRSSDDDLPLEHGERYRATGDPERTTKDETNSNFEYVESNESIRYPAKRSGGEVVEYGTTPFERWAAIQAGTAAVEHVSTAFDPPLDEREGVLASDRGELSDPLVLVRHVTRPRGPSETGTIDPDLGTTRLVERLPRTLTVTIEFADRSQTTRFPVYVQRANYVEHPESG